VFDTHYNHTACDGGHGVRTMYVCVFVYTCVCVRVCVCMCVWVSSLRATLADLPRSEDTPPTVNVAPPKNTNTQPGGHGPPSHCGPRLHRGSTCGPTARGRRRMVVGPLPACIGNHLVGGGRSGSLVVLVRSVFSCSLSSSWSSSSSSSCKTPHTAPRTPLAPQTT
jgi:hypothetical protein